MLICYHNSAPLPRSDLVYLAFYLALTETLTDIETTYEFAEEDDCPCGFLLPVPFLRSVPLAVQAELMGNTWSLHSATKKHVADLLDAAIVYAAFETAARIISDEPELAVDLLKLGPRSLNPRIVQRAPERLEALFERWWDDQDFLWIDDLADVPPDQARQAREFLRVPEEMVQPMFEALGRGRASFGAAEKLAGLIKPGETTDVPLLLSRTPLSARRYEDADVAKYGESTLVDGLRDDYHNVLIGPCTPEAIASATECPLVFEVFAAGEDCFDCTHQEWVEHLREMTHEVADAPRVPLDSLTDVLEIADDVDAALASELPNGYQAQEREQGWFVFDGTDSYLCDVDNAEWVYGDHDEEMPPLLFESREEAC